MSRDIATAIAFDVEFLNDASAMTPSSAAVHGRGDGRMRSVDVARLVWPDENVSAGVNYMAGITDHGPLGRC